jgi:hypothetical protein
MLRQFWTGTDPTGGSRQPRPGLMAVLGFVVVALVVSVAVMLGPTDFRI